MAASVAVVPTRRDSRLLSYAGKDMRYMLLEGGIAMVMFPGQQALGCMCT